MTVACPTTFAGGEAPVRWRMLQDPGGGEMLGLEDEEQRTHRAGRIYHLDSSYPLLPTLYLLPTALVANIDRCSRSLARTDRETRLIYVVYL